MIVESSNPAHSLADSQRFREALEALELVVVIDVAMTETARLADYVLPAASQYEKPEATFFNLEFPAQQLPSAPPAARAAPRHAARARDRARLVRALGVVDAAALEPLREAARESRAAYAQALMTATADDPSLARVLPYRPLRDARADAARGPRRGRPRCGGSRSASAMTYPDAVRRAGHADGDALFDAILEGRSGITFTVDEYEDDFGYIAHPDKRIALEIPELLDGAPRAARRPPGAHERDFPVVLSVGERRSYTANDIIRNPGWRKRDPTGPCASARRTPRGSGSATAAAPASPPPAAAPTPRSR